MSEAKEALERWMLLQPVAMAFSNAMSESGIMVSDVRKHIVTLTVLMLRGTAAVIAESVDCNNEFKELMVDIEDDLRSEDQLLEMLFKALKEKNKGPKS